MSFKIKSTHQFVKQHPDPPSETKISDIKLNTATKEYEWLKTDTTKPTLQKSDKKKGAYMRSVPTAASDWY
jgi:hypothetical protein